MAYCSSIDLTADIDTGDLESTIESCVEDAIEDLNLDDGLTLEDLEISIKNPCGTWEQTIDDMLIASFKRILEEGDNYDLFGMMGEAIKEAAEGAAKAAVKDQVAVAVTTVLTIERERVAALDAQAFMRELTKQEVSDGQDL